MSTKEKMLTILKEIKTKIDKDGYAKKETCSIALYGWDHDEYMFMPSVAEALRDMGYLVNHSKNHGVIDWEFKINLNFSAEDLKNIK